MARRSTKVASEPQVRSLTRAAGEFVAGVAYQDLPADAVRTARTGFTDCIGTMIAGSVEAAPKLMRRVLGIGGGSGEASLYLGRERGPAPERRLDQRGRRPCARP